MTTSKNISYPVDRPYSVSTEEIARKLQSDLKLGLSDTEGIKRIGIYGLNSYKEQKERHILLVLIDQFKSPIILLLLMAGGVSFSFQHWLEGFSIVGVILITAALGFAMELQARRSIRALKQMDVNLARVWRDNRVVEIASEKIVPGDMLVLEAGDIVPADGRLIEINQFQTDESALTGESMPVAKTLHTLEKGVILAEQENMVFKGTSVLKGNARAIVTATGRFTELGKIASLVETAEQDETPLEIKLQGLTKKLMWITGALTAIFFIQGVLRGANLYLILETAIALAVASIPEGLPIVATIALTYGMLRMARKNVLIKKLASVETLGSINIIFTDKTGTLTENKIEAGKLVFFDETVTLGKDGSESSEICSAKNKFALDKLFLVSILCNNAVIKAKSENKKELGDPIEIALLHFVKDNHVRANEIKKQYPRLAEEAFSSETKIMATLHKQETGLFVASKGAVEEILPKCNSYLHDSEVVPLTASEHRVFSEKAEALQAKGFRLLAFAYREGEGISSETYLKDLTLVGFIGFVDPPRLDITGAIQSCREAGIKVIMITGDHPATALNIAEKIKLSDSENVVVTGKELESHQSDKKILEATIFARVNPKQKLDMVSHYQKKGAIVAMTGDGINDAPALKKANIGIAMGLRGTQVAKETAAIVLKDDSFVSIVAAIEQGRVIFQNIRRFLVYLLSCNLSEILIVFLFGFMRLSFSILPLQILFLNLVTDIFPALALGMGKGNYLMMKNFPRNPKTPIITPKDWMNIVIYALLLTTPIVATVWYCRHFLHYSSVICNNIAFLSLTFAQLWHVFNLSSAKLSFIANEVTRNKFMWAALLLCNLIVATFYWIRPLKAILGIQDLDLTVWSIIIIISIMPVILIQILKRWLKIIE